MTPRRVRIQAGDHTFEAALHDTPAAEAVWRALPLQTRVSTWGDEIYGDIGVEVALSADATDLAEIGDVAIWPPGNALCIFFGPTPVSVQDEPRAASALAPVGHIEDVDVAALRSVPDGAVLTVEAARGLLR